MKNICVFCGARQGLDPIYAEAARRCGELIAEYGLNLLYGGSNSGLMAKISDAVVDNGGKVIGIYPGILNQKEPLNPRIDVPIIVETMSIRKNVMISNADAFIILPGGAGTLDELFEVMTLKILGWHNKPIIIISTDNYWKSFEQLCEDIVTAGFAAPVLFDTYRIVATPEEAFKQLGF